MHAKINNNNSWKLFFILIILIPGIVLGFGYWHSITHGSTHIELFFKSSDSDKRGLLPEAEVFFIGSDNHILAKGISDENYGYIHLIHPEEGDCHKFGKMVSNSQSRNLWQQCFEKQSTWIMKWVKDIHFVKIKHNLCTTGKIPIDISEYNSEWLLWWVPLPHVGGKPYSYFSSKIVVEEKSCLK